MMTVIHGFKTVLDSPAKAGRGCTANGVAVSLEHCSANVSWAFATDMASSVQLEAKRRDEDPEYTSLRSPDRAEKELKVAILFVRVAIARTLQGFVCWE